MKRTLIATILAACLLAGAASASSAGGAVYERSQSVGDLTYTNTICYSASGARLETFGLETAPGGDVYPIVMACDTIYGGMTLDSVVKYASSLGYNVAAAINSDYFYGSSIPIGLVIENGVYKSSPEWNNAAAFLNDGGMIVSEAPKITIELQNRGGAELVPDEEGSVPESNEGKTVTLTHYNKTRADGGGAYLLNSYYSTVSTRTSTDGWMVRLKVLEGSMTVSGTVELEVTELIEGSAAQKIGDGYMILTADATSNLTSEFKKFAVGDRVTLTTACSDERLADAKWATGVGSILVSGGAITDSSGWGLSTTGKNPRSALGVRADGSVVALAADGRRSSYSNGLTMSELAQDLLDMGCVYAVNMDGGGSTVLGVKATGQSVCTAVSSPSDGAQRKCAAYILFVTDKTGDGAASALALKNDGALVFTGSKLSLDFAASDAGLAPVALSGGVAASGTLGSVRDGVYTAGSAAGRDTLTLSYGGASGTGSVFVVDSLASVTAYADGKQVTSLTLESGQTVQFSASASKWGRTAAVDQSAYVVTAADCGTADAAGLFTAGAPGSSGTVTVSAGGAKAVVKIQVKMAFDDCEGHWAESFINSLADRGVVSGTGAAEFSPESGIKRGDFMLMLYRAAGEPAVSGASRFTDVESGKYYEQAIVWASQAGIAQGDGAGGFMPEAALTREQGFTFLYRALGALGVKADSGGESALEAFTDADSLAAYARESAAGLVSMGIVGGSGGALDPQGGLTRAQMAKLLYAALEMK